MLPSFARRCWIKRVYDALVDGAQAGLSDKALYTFVMEQCPKATSKKIVKASLLALSDKDLNDANILQVIYALAIKHRHDPVSDNDIEPSDAANAPTIKPKKVKKQKVGPEK